MKFQHSKIQSIDESAYKRRNNFQRFRFVYRRIGVHRRIGVPAYQLSTFNTTDWYIVVHRQISEPRKGVSTFQLLTWRTKQIDAHWTIFEELMATVHQPLAVNGNTGVDRPCFQLDAFVDHSVRTTSKTACRISKRAVFCSEKVAGSCHRCKKPV